MPARFLPPLALALLLSSCGTGHVDRGLSGAGIGAAGGMVLGPAGALAGAAAGATAGILTDREDVYLGKPAWD